MAFEYSSNIRKLGERPYKRERDVFSMHILRHCHQIYNLYPRPTRSTLLAPLSTAPSISSDGESMDFYRDQGPLGLFTPTDIPARTVLFSIKLNDKTENHMQRDIVSVHSSLELMALLNPPGGGGKKRKLAKTNLCAAMHDYTYMGVNRPAGAPTAASMEVPKHIHQFIAFPNTGSWDDLLNAALVDHKWYDVGNTAAILVNGLETNFNCEFDVVCRSAVGIRGGKSKSPGVPDTIVLRSLDETIPAGSELTVEY